MQLRVRDLAGQQIPLRPAFSVVPNSSNAVQIERPSSLLQESLPSHRREA